MWHNKDENKMKRFYIPEGYSEKECDGCGSGWNEKIVPDSIFTLDIRTACYVHDYMYLQGGSDSDRLFADMVLLNNILFLIEEKKEWLYPTRLARYRAMTYYQAVREFGAPYFEAHNKTKEVGR